MVDVSVTADISCEDKFFPKETVIRTRYVLDWDFHRTEFVEFVIFDVLIYGGREIIWRWV